MSLELKNTFENTSKLIKLQLRKNYTLIWVLLAASVLCSILELIKVFSWNVVENLNYAIELGEFTGAYLSFFLPALIIFESRKILTDSSISMYPGTPLSRYWSRITTDCIMLFVIPLCICLESILQYGLLSLFNLIGITSVILPFSWGYLLYHLIAQTLLGITVYSFLLVIWMLIAKLPLWFSITLFVGLVLAIVSGTFGFVSFEVILDEAFYFLTENAGSAGVLPDSMYVMNNMILTVPFLALGALLASQRKICQESSAANVMSTILCVSILLYIGAIFLVSSSSDETCSFQSPPSNVYQASSIKKEIALKENSDNIAKIITNDRITTTPLIKNPAAEVETTADTYLSGGDLGIYPEYYSPYTPWNQNDKKDYASSQTPLKSDTTKLYVVAEELQLDGAGYVFQDMINEMTVTLDDAYLNVTLPSSPIVFNKAFGTKYYKSEAGGDCNWSSFIDWVYGAEGNPFYQMKFIVQGTQEIEMSE